MVLVMFSNLYLSVNLAVQFILIYTVHVEGAVACRTFSRAWSTFPVFPPLEPVACFPALGTCFLFSRAWIFAQFWSVVRFYFDVIRANRLAVNLG